MITVPQLDPVSQIQATDVIMITHADGTTEKITGAYFKKMGNIPKNHTLRIFFEKVYIVTTLNIQVQGIGGVWIRISWFSGSNGVVTQIYEDSGYLKLRQLNGAIESLSYTFGDGYIDIFNPNNETEAFVLSENVKSFLII